MNIRFVLVFLCLIKQALNPEEASSPPVIEHERASFFGATQAYYEYVSVIHDEVVMNGACFLRWHRETCKTKLLA